MVLSYNVSSGISCLTPWPSIFQHPLQQRIDAAAAAAVAAADVVDAAAVEAAKAAAVEQMLQMSSYDEAGVLTAHLSDCVTVQLVKPADLAQVNEVRQQQQQHFSTPGSRKEQQQLQLPKVPDDELGGTSKYHTECLLAGCDD